jgi:DNA-directed RNA polymerase specialized sigma24 family protein
MSPGGSVARWLHALQGGDPAAAQDLWQHYFERLVRLARRKLRDAPRRAADEEDVALSAFDSFCRGAAQGRFPRLADRDDLWRLLVVIAARKALDQAARERRQKRGGGAVRGESALSGPPNSPGAEAGLDQIVGPSPTPEFAAQVAEEYQHLLDRLGDDGLREIAVAKMEGYTHEEIAARLGCAVVTVGRRLDIIRKLWQEPRT